MSLTGEPDGAPQKVGVPLADLFAGLYGCIGILAALRHREATGRGQQIDIGMLDAHVAWLANQGMNYLATGENPARLGNQHPNIVPYQVFATSDGFIVLSIGNDPTFRRFCKDFGLEPLLGDARFASNAARVENRALVTDTLAAVLKRQTTAWWVERLEALQIGCGPINTLKEVFHRQPGAPLRDAARLPPAAAAARRAHRRGAARAAGHGRRRDRRAASQGHRLSTSDQRGKRSAPSGKTPSHFPVDKSTGAIAPQHERNYRLGVNRNKPISRRGTGGLRCLQGNCASRRGAAGVLPNRSTIPRRRRLSRCMRASSRNARNCSRRSLCGSRRRRRDRGQARRRATGGSALDQPDLALERESQIQKMRFYLRVIGQADEQIALLRRIAQVASALERSLLDGCDGFH